ncbi:hypothetical protein, partial [Mesorhizobium sp. M1C.F.Ca.ET.187.01.1.1]|uniref:hypothetical protein n=1 Tax=Mesorhizobium sp. M1C.F.Ca.ET.187.01.1.1 TaxID=2563923 RepID=UPI001AEEF777
PFSTIKFPHEDGGSKAVWGARGASSLGKHAICPADNLGFVAVRTSAVYSEGLGLERDSCG